MKGYKNLHKKINKLEIVDYFMKFKMITYKKHILKFYNIQIKNTIYKKYINDKIIYKPKILNI